MHNKTLRNIALLLALTGCAAQKPGTPIPETPGVPAMETAGRTLSDAKTTARKIRDNVSKSISAEACTIDGYRLSSKFHTLVYYWAADTQGAERKNEAISTLIKDFEDLLNVGFRYAVAEQTYDEALNPDAKNNRMQTFVNDFLPRMRDEFEKKILKIDPEADTSGNFRYISAKSPGVQDTTCPTRWYSADNGASADLS